MMGMMLIASVQRNCQALLIHVAQTKRVGRQPRAKPSGHIDIVKVIEEHCV